MENIKYKILEALAEISDPYADIRKLDGQFDRGSKHFIAAFRELESEGLIKSANTRDCGLEVGADGYASWSVVDLYVTEAGKRALAEFKARG